MKCRYSRCRREVCRTTGHKRHYCNARCAYAAKKERMRHRYRRDQSFRERKRRQASAYYRLTRAPEPA